MFHGCGESLAVYRCDNKKVDAHCVYTNTVPAGAFRGYGLSQMIFAVESAVDELARRLGMDPVELRRRNVVRDGDPMLSTHPTPRKTCSTAATGSTSASTWPPTRSHGAGRATSPRTARAPGPGRTRSRTWARSGVSARGRRCP